MDIQAYFGRIDHLGLASPNLETLRALHRAHLSAVPFENLDIHLGRRIRLDEASLLEKVVVRRRGGFCYELNGLFAGLLRRLGFRVTLLSADIPLELGGCGLGFDHLILLVELDKRWIVDVGFGDSHRVPLNLDERGEQSGAEGARYRISKDNQRWKFEVANQTGGWSMNYECDLNPRLLSDFQPASTYYELNPASGFRRKRITSRATEKGHVSLTNDRLIWTFKGVRREEPVARESDYLRVLQRHFGISLEDERWRIPWELPVPLGSPPGA